MVLDLAIFSVTPILALILRTETLNWSEEIRRSLLVVTLVFGASKIATFYVSGLYKRYWRYASVGELSRISAIGLVAIALQTLLFYCVLLPLGWVSSDFPHSIPLIEGFLAMVAAAGLRYSVRLGYSVRDRTVSRQQQGGQRVVVAGARSVGVMIVQEMQSNPKMGMVPVAFVDNDEEKRGGVIRGVPVLGTISEIPKVCAKTGANKVIIAMPRARGRVIREILHICEEAGLQVKTVPGMYEVLEGTVSVKQLRDVAIEDLLRREVVRTHNAAVSEMLRGKRVLVTGGGGSIGSELCRQVLRFKPESLIIVGRGENSVFEIQNELNSLLARQESISGRSAETRIEAVIADVRSAGRIYAVFEEQKPDVIFHAAAHKHVPLMEANPAEAVTNNIMGTLNVLKAAEAVGAGHFVMISTDKAVNPTSVMGASKRVAEYLVHESARRSGRPYVAVRFGNVLGSRGSVVLTFTRQIAAGGPVTVTHPDMKRYFMTIPEAVQLVLQAATLASGGEVFMLDMGEPVKISDLAHDLIRLSGLQVGEDIEIKYTGLRPGEKLFEEMFLSVEEYTRTEHEKIFYARNAANFIPPSLDETVESLIVAALHNHKPTVLAGLEHLVPEFRLQTKGLQADTELVALARPVHGGGVAFLAPMTLDTAEQLG